jgi:alpha-2-macroglobulin
MNQLRYVLCCSLAIAGCLVMLVWAQQAKEPNVLRSEAEQLRRQGNWNDALARLRGLVADPNVPGAEAAQDLKAAVECLQQLGLLEQLDPLVESALATHPASWQVLAQAARSLRDAPHYGMIFDGQFVRSPQRRDSGRWITVQEQDRQRALALLVEAISLATGERLEATIATAEKAAAAEAGNAAPRGTGEEVAGLMLETFRELLNSRSDRFAWRLQTKTPLDAAPDYLDFDAPQHWPARFASVDEAGQPIFWQQPEAWSQAGSDAERLRYLLGQIQNLDAQTYTQARFEWAALVDSQFSVDTLQEEVWLMRSLSVRAAADAAADGKQQGEADVQGSILALHTLGTNETIAKLASGIRRFELPDEFNSLRIFQELAQEKSTTGEMAAQRLVQIFLNRRQFPQAAEVLRAAIERFGDEHGNRRDQLNNIVQPRGAFDPAPTQPAGTEAKLSFVFRNAKQANFTAHAVDLEKLLADIKAFYRAMERGQQPGFGGKPDTGAPAIEHPAELFSGQKLDRYVGGEVASWTLELQPRENHWDRRIDVTTPLQKSGLYVVSVALGDDQHQARTLLWIQDTALVRKPIDQGQLMYVADAATGLPLADMNVEFFGFAYRQDNVRGRTGIVTRNFAKKSDAQGMVVLTEKELEGNAQWLTIARGPSGPNAGRPGAGGREAGGAKADGRLAVLGLQGLWVAQLGRETITQFKAYGVADQPIHRPGDKLKAKFWLAQASYAPEAASHPGANMQCEVQLFDPQGKVFWSGTKQTDEYGGLDVEVDLPASATLGVYRFQLQAGGRGWVQSELQVRVEEFRKPEFEVKIDAPDKPVQLGEKIEAKISAKYYFGSPVTDAYVNVRVTRTSYTDTWFPPQPFDWCYGPGYWWPAYDYPWYPGWSNWRGCIMPPPWWLPRWGFEPPESVLDQELTLDENGEAKFTIDSSVAAQIFGDQDHKYEISVEVRDASRRTLTASGSVIASREPFKIYSWLGRGFYRVGQTVDAHFTARTLGGTAVQGTGKLDLLRVTYDENRQPEETVVESWEVASDEDGQVTQRFSANRAGQYRLRLRLKDAAGHEVEGAYVFTIRGGAAAGEDFRFSAIELVPDQKHYSVGGTVQLQINADRDDALVMLFVRPSGGVYPRPQWVRLAEKTKTVEIPVAAGDQPNFFVEAVTVYEGRVHSTVREIIVPPENRVLDVAVKPNKEEYLPGEEAELEVLVKDLEGRPMQGSLLLAVYDRALEQLAGDVLPGDIREFFWKWRRSHHPHTSENLSRQSHPIYLEGVPQWSPLGLFGHSVADDAEFHDAPGRAAGLGGMGGGMGGGFGGEMRGRGGVFGGPAGAAMRGGMAMGGMGAEGMVAEGMVAAAPAMAMDAKLAAPMAALGMGGEVAAAPAAATSLRSQFADSALWLTNVTSDRNGRATAKFKMPENLTGWKVRTWALGRDVRVGSADSQVVTRKNILVRIAAPRFLVERDEVTLSAIVHNDLPDAHDVRVRLEIDGETQLEMLADQAAEQSVRIASHGQARVDWRCHASAAGTVKIRVVAETPVESDAMQIDLPVIVHGTLKTDSWAGTVRADSQRATLEVKVPEQRRVEQSRLTVRLSPSLALAMVDALPYLAEYPYGCTEQTLNRFVPTVITHKLLQDMQIDLQRVKTRRNNLNAQELGKPAERVEGWKRFDRNPVFDSQEVAEMVDAGVRKLTEMQNQDGGWGWFSGIQERSWPHTTAVVVRGLLAAQQSGAAIVPDVLERGLAWLEQYQREQLLKLSHAPAKTEPFKEQPDNLDALVFHILVQAGRGLGGAEMVQMQSELYEKRNALSVYGKTLVALATHRLGNAEQTAMLRQNIEQFLVEDAENETAYLRDESPWWIWYGSDIEAAAMYLKLLAAQDPQGRVAPRLVKYLLNNRKHATYWRSTRDTALVVEAFGDYLRASGEAAPEVSAEVLLGGKRLGTVRFTPDNLFEADNTIEIEGNAIAAGTQQLEIRRSGRGPLYWNVYLANFTLEDEIEPAGLEVKIERRYYRLDPVKKALDLAGSRGEVVNTQRQAYDRTRVEDLQELPSGTLVEVELLVESKNDYEYLIIEDRKAAGMEPVDTQSGYQWGDGLGLYRELRARHVAFFARALPRGKHSFRYQLRTEAPGNFTALPAAIHGMYAPELVGNSADFDLRVIDEERTRAEVEADEPGAQ